jgi:hypothetical protein
MEFFLSTEETWKIEQKRKEDMRIGGFLFFSLFNKKIAC